jgi:FG-GAP repeat/Cadherin-like beta sandwich domain
MLRRAWLAWSVALAACGSYPALPPLAGSADANVEPPVDAPAGGTPDGAPDAVVDSAPQGDGPLANLTSSAGSLVPAFSPGVTDYTVAVPFATESARLTATAGIPGEVAITMDGVSTASGAPGPVTVLDLDVPRTVEVSATPTGGAAVVYRVTLRRTPITIGAPVFVKPTVIGAGDTFGAAVAISGDFLVVGAPLEDSGTAADPSDKSALNSGAAYVFHRSGLAWNQVAYLKSAAPATGERYGAVVAIDGDTVVIGAPGERSTAAGIGGNPATKGGEAIGAVFVYTRVGATWPLQAYIKAAAPDPYDNFGTSIALQGNTLVVGSPGESAAIGAAGIDNSLPDSGATFVFGRTGTTWNQKTRLKASNAEANDEFGHAVALSGGTLIASATEEDSATTGTTGEPADNSGASVGAVYVFDGAGASWTQSAYLKPASLPSSRFGWNLAFNGSRLVATPNGFNGATFLRGAGSWQLGSDVGWTSAAIGLAADRVFVGFPGLTRVSLFGLAGPGYTSGSQTITDASAIASDGFGAAVAVSGTTLVVGAPGNDSGTTSAADNSATDAGGVYVYVH